MNAIEENVHIEISGEITNEATYSKSTVSSILKSKLKFDEIKYFEKYLFECDEDEEDLPPKRTTIKCKKTCSERLSMYAAELKNNRKKKSNRKKGSSKSTKKEKSQKDLVLANLSDEINKKSSNKDPCPGVKLEGRNAKRRTKAVGEDVQTLVQLDPQNLKVSLMNQKGEVTHTSLTEANNKQTISGNIDSPSHSISDVSCYKEINKEAFNIEETHEDVAAINDTGICPSQLLDRLSRICLNSKENGKTNHRHLLKPKTHAEKKSCRKHKVHRTQSKSAIPCDKNIPRSQTQSITSIHDKMCGSTVKPISSISIYTKCKTEEPSSESMNIGLKSGEGGDRRWVRLNVAQETCTESHDYRLRFIEYLVDSPLYRSNIFKKPWQALNRITEAITDEILLKEIRKLEKTGI